MNLRNGRTTGSIPSFQHDGIRKKRSAKGRDVALQAERKKKIHLNDACLSEAIIYLTRDDIDLLPLVSRQFRRVVSTPAFQVYGPSRRLDYYGLFNGGVGTLMVLSTDTTRWPRFFAQFPKVCEYTTKMEYGVAPAKMVENLQRYPWLRAEITSLSTYLISKAKIKKNAWSHLRQLWNGQKLYVYGSPSSVPVDLSPLASNCKEMLIGSNSGLISISFAEWISSGQCKGCQNLELSGGVMAIPPSDAASFLMADNPTECKRLVKISFPAQPYPLGELIEAIKEVGFPGCCNVHSCAMEQLQMFLSTLHPRPFELQGRQCKVGQILDEQDYSVQHPTADGKCTVRIQWEKEEDPSEGFNVEVKYPSV